MSTDLTEILAEHADQLNRGKSVDAEALLGKVADKKEELASLLTAAARAKRALKPVRPTMAFRNRLHDGLAMASHHRQAHQILVVKENESQWNWLIGAAALTSAAGLIALVWKVRSQKPVPVAQSCAISGSNLSN